MRYKQTFLGVAWALLVPALTTAVYVIVFGKFANFPHGNTPYPVLTAAGVIPMQYFAVRGDCVEHEPRRRTCHS